MPQHYNLYYLFLEDMRRYPISEKRNQEIQKVIEDFCKRIEPPWLLAPPDSITGESLNQQSYQQTTIKKKE